VYEDGGRFKEFVGGYDDWLRQQVPLAEERNQPAKKREKPVTTRPRKLSFKEKQELTELPLQIETLENELAGLHAKLADPAFYQAGDGAAIAAGQKRLEELDALLAHSYQRWEELDGLSA